MKAQETPWAQVQQTEGRKAVWIIFTKQFISNSKQWNITHFLSHCFQPMRSGLFEPEFVTLTESVCLEAAGSSLSSSLFNVTLKTTKNRNILWFSTDEFHKDTKSRRVYAFHDSEFWLWEGSGTNPPLQLCDDFQALDLKPFLLLDPVFPKHTVDISSRLSLTRPLQLVRRESLKNVSSSALWQVAQALQLPQTLRRETWRRKEQPIRFFTCFFNIWS